ncbi:MAG TPA: TraR/DksA C4-type zinc finger protein [Chloroflexia bacterium]|nr:TraR/DksA C4-type zinc finger protein [Chloroflexia bacterium]
MTLLANRDKTTTPADEAVKQDGRTATGRKISFSPKPAAREASPVAAPPVEALRTLRARLQAQVDKNGADPDGHTDPEARYLLQSVRRRLSQVDAALERIEMGKYGECADCHAPIESDRLVLQPMSTRCTRCQSVAEWRGATY